MVLVTGKNLTNSPIRVYDTDDDPVHFGVDQRVSADVVGLDKQVLDIYAAAGLFAAGGDEWVLENDAWDDSGVWLIGKSWL